MGQEEAKPVNPDAAIATGDKQPQYDVVLRCKPSDLCSASKGFWEAEFSSSRNAKDVLRQKSKLGVAIGILGNFNRGKTWIMSRLCNCELPGQGLIWRTDGLSLKWVGICGDPTDSQQSTFDHVVIDTAGINSPIDLLEEKTEEVEAAAKSDELCDEMFSKIKAQRQAKESQKKGFSKIFQEKAQESGQYEDFLLSVTLQLSDCIIVVMNETTYPDQTFLHKVVEKWVPLCRSDSSSEHLRRDADVYVVHNFLRTTCSKERDTLFKTSTESVYPGQLQNRDGIPRFSCTQADFRTQHVCLMCDNNEEGRAYNDKVFHLLKQWMHSRVKQTDNGRGPAELIERFSTCAETILTRGYLHNLKEIKAKFVENKLHFQAVKQDEKNEIERSRTVEDRAYGAIEGVSLPMSISTYTSKSEKKCKLIYLEMAGVDMSTINVEPDDSSSIQGHYAVKLKAEKKNTDLLQYLRGKEEVQKDEQFLPDSKPDLRQDELESDSCRYGEINKIFQIPLNFDPDHSTFVRKDGTVLLVFKERQKKVAKLVYDS